MGTLQVRRWCIDPAACLQTLKCLIHLEVSGPRSQQTGSINISFLGTRVGWRMYRASLGANLRTEKKRGKWENLLQILRGPATTESQSGVGRENDKLFSSKKSHYQHIKSFWYIQLFVVHNIHKFDLWMLSQKSRKKKKEPMLKIGSKEGKLLAHLFKQHLFYPSEIGNPSQSRVTWRQGEPSLLHPHISIIIKWAFCDYVCEVYFPHYGLYHSLI